MATKSTGAVLQTWVSPKFAREVSELADRDGRTVSNLIRNALQDRLETSPPAGESRRPAGVDPRSSAAAPDTFANKERRHG